MVIETIPPDLRKSEIRSVIRNTLIHVEIGSDYTKTESRKDDVGSIYGYLHTMRGKYPSDSKMATCISRALANMSEMHDLLCEEG